MEIETMKQLFRQEGWTLHLLKRRNKGRVYVYAARRVGKKQEHIYIASLEKVKLMTEEELIGRLRRAS